MFSPQIVFQTMLDPLAVSTTGPPPPPPPPDPRVGLSGPLGDVMEGGQAQFAINRTNNIAGNVSVDWTATAPSGDTTGALAGTLSLATGNNINLDVIVTVNRAGLQAEPRQIHITLSNPVGGSLDSAASVLDIPIRNRTLPLPTWYNLPRRSGRAWASGTSGLIGSLAVDPNAALEQTVALNDAGFGSTRGGGTQARVSTWDNVIGGPLGGPLLTTGTQFEWTESSGFGLNFQRSPLGAVWLLWDMSLFPNTQATNTGNPAVWTELANGTRDAEMRAMGARIVQAFAAKGHNINRFIGCPHVGMNAGGYYQVFASTRLAYKAAMERAIDQMRQGAVSAQAGAVLRFAHCPSEYPYIGNLADWTPSNVDAIGLNYDVNNTTVDAVGLADYLDNTGLSQHYGLRTDLIDVADRMNLPIVIPRWIVQNTATIGCPYSLEAVNRFYTDFLQPNAARIVCDCMASTALLDASAYAGPGGAPAGALWAQASASFKAKWDGIKSTVVYNPPTISISPDAATVQEGN
jgi:hypothetical protein